MKQPRLPERPHGDHLGWLAVSPLVWAAHLLISYCAVAIYCAKYAPPDGEVTEVRWAVLVLTVLALAVIGWVARLGYVRHRSGQGIAPHDHDTEEDRHRFFGLATFFLSLLSGVATLFTALVFFMMETCH